MSVPKGSPGLFVSMAKPLKPSPFPHKPGVIKAQPAIMEVASLIMGAIPILVLCGQAASVIQKFYKNVRGELRKKCKRLVQDIDALLVKMRLIQDVKPSNTALVDDATKLKDMLESLVADLRGLVPPSIFTITLRTGNIENRINEALQQVATCQTSFNITCAYYLLVASANIQNNIDQLATNSNHQATSIMGGLRGMERILGRIEQQASASENEHRSRSLTPVNVRYFGSNDDKVYHVDIKDRILHLTQQMLEENIDVDDIHFFSWSQGRHSCSDSGQMWRPRGPNVQLSTIMNQCGKRDNQDVEWRLEYVRESGQFTIFLVCGLHKEAGVLIHLPLDAALENKLKGICSCDSLVIETCYDLETKLRINWTDVGALCRIKSCTNSLCIKLKKCSCSYESFIFCTSQ